MRTNYRVLAYYDNSMYSSECYIFIINARCQNDVSDYMDSSDLYYEFIDEEQCWDIEDCKKADSILIDGVRIYNDSKKYKSAIDIVDMEV